jgi:hypothetical protein
MFFTKILAKKFSAKSLALAESMSVSNVSAALLAEYQKLQIKRNA